MNALVQVGGIRVASRTSAFRARKEGDRSVRDCPRAVGGPRPRGQRSDVREPAAGHGAAHRCRERLPALVGAVRPRGDRRLRHPGRDCRWRRQCSESPARAPLGHRSRACAGARPGTPTAVISRAGTFAASRTSAGQSRVFEEAVRLDPAHAPSWTGLAEITVLAAHMGMIPPRAACTSARKMLATAKELQGESADGLHVEAFAAFLERRWDAMETAWRRALELQPDHVLALGSFAITLCARQRLDEALPLFARARAADPLASFPYTLAGWGLLMCGQPEEGLRHIEDALTFEKEDASAICALSIANVALESPPTASRRASMESRWRVVRRSLSVSGLGARGGGSKRRCPRGSRRAASPARWCAHRRLRGVAPRRARGGRRRL